MANPPSVVKMALESICTLLGEKGDTWKGIRSVVMKDNFISTIVNFETENVTLVASRVILSSYVYESKSRSKKFNNAQKTFKFLPIIAKTKSWCNSVGNKYEYISN